MRRFVIGLLFAGGCAQDVVGQGAAAIIGGTPTYEYPAVVAVVRPDGAFCTGSLVAPDVVLTAAHCQFAPGATAMVIDLDEPVASQDVVEVAFHRYHNGGDELSDHDISLLRLAGALPAEPLPFVTASLGEYPVGTTVTAVGFGVDDGVELTGAGVKRMASFTIGWATTDYLVGGEPGTSTCFGDSGGPALDQIDGVTTIVGVTRSGGETCRARSAWTRVDSYAADFVIPFVDAWSGPCRFDATCVTDGCRTPDPDCAPCGVDGICSAGCATLDLDCPVAGGFGDACSAPDDCESRLCAEGDGGETTCSQTCDQVERFCPGGYRCQPDGEVQVCVAIAEEDGGCSAGGGAGGAPAALALLVSCLACSRGRRRRRRCRGTP